MPTSNISQFLSKILPTFKISKLHLNIILKYMLHYQTHAEATFYHRDILYNRIFCVLSLYLLLCIFKKILNKIYLGFSNLDRNFSFSLYRGILRLFQS
jgi:hypothetical protein